MRGPEKFPEFAYFGSFSDKFRSQIPKRSFSMLCRALLVPDHQTFRPDTRNSKPYRQTQLQNRKGGHHSDKDTTSLHNKRDTNTQDRWHFSHTHSTWRFPSIEMTQTSPPPTRGATNPIQATIIPRHWHSLTAPGPQPPSSIRGTRKPMIKNTRQTTDSACLALLWK